MDDLQTDLGETLLSSQRDDNHGDLNNAGALMVHTMMRRSQASKPVTGIVGPSRAITSYVGIPCRVPLCSVRLAALMTHLLYR